MVNILGIKEDYLRRWNLNINSKQNLSWSDFDLCELANKFGTPVHIINESIIFNNLRRFISLWNKEFSDIKIFYWIKANNTPFVIKLLEREGHGIAISSEDELKYILKLKVDMNKVIVGGIGKTHDFLRLSLIKGIKTIIIESIRELIDLEKICIRYNRKVEIILRIHVNRFPLSFTQFGLTESEIRDAMSIIKDSVYLLLKGFHFNIGTSIFHVKLYNKVIKKVTNYLKIFKNYVSNVPIIDIGGGFPSWSTRFYTLTEQILYKTLNYQPKIKAKKNNYDAEMVNKIAKCLRIALNKNGIKDIILYLEPGRYLVETAQITLTKVLDVKDRKFVNFAITELGVCNNAYPMNYEYHHIFLVNDLIRRRKRWYRIVGRVLSTVDILHRKFLLPELKQGDILALMDTGAYFIAFSNRFSFTPPKVIIIDSQHNIKREKFFKFCN